MKNYRSFSLMKYIPRSFPEKINKLVADFGDYRVSFGLFLSKK